MFKKIVTSILAVAILGSMGLTVFASDFENAKTADLPVDNGDTGLQDTSIL